MILLSIFFTCSSQLLITLIFFIIFIIFKNIKYFNKFYKTNNFITYNISDEELIEKIGFDSIVFIRMIRCIRNIFLFASIITCSSLLPLHIISPPSSLSWENYDKSNNLLWVHVICCWLLIIYIMAILVKYNIEITSLRILFIKKQKKNPEYHTVYISDIPDNIDILDECKKIYGYDSILKVINIKLHSAFIIFKKRVSHVIAITSLHHRERLTWVTRAAPKINEIIFKNLDISIYSRVCRKIVMWVIYFIILLFYIIPVSAIQGLILVLSEKLIYSLFYKLIADLLTALLMHIVMIILPKIFEILYRTMGSISTYDIDFGIVKMLYYFQIITLFFGSIISGSVFDNFKLVFSDPNSILSILFSGIISASYFFINYICVAGIGGIGIRNLRITSLIKYIIKKGNVTSELWYNQCIPLYMIIYVMGITYSCINPIINPIICIYALISIIFERYNHIYIYEKKHESGGVLWICIFNQFMIGIYIFEIIMLLEFYIAYPKFLSLLPLPLLTLIYHYINNVLFNQLLNSIPLHDAALLDENEILSPLDIDILINTYDNDSI